MILYIILLVSALFWIYKKLDRNYLLDNGVPGTRLGFFNVIGHTSYIPRRQAIQSQSFNTYSLQVLSGFGQLHQKHSYFVNWAVNIPFLHLHRAESVEELLKSTTILEKGRLYNFLHPWLQKGLLTSSGRKWKNRRKLLTPSFHFDILKEFLTVINEKAQVLVDILKDSLDKEWIDITKLMTLCSLDIICETTLGISIDAQRNKDSEYVKAVDRASESIMHRMNDPFQWLDFIYYKTKRGKQFINEIENLHAFTKKIIENKKMSLNKKEVEEDTYCVYRKRKALMDLLVEHHMSNKDFSENDIQEEVDTFTFEGHDTTAMGLTWSLYLIGLHHEVQNKIQEEIDVVLPRDNEAITTTDLSELKYLECAIKESLRIYPSVPVISRRTTEIVSFCGHEFPKGTEVSVFIYGLHRDTKVFPNSEAFDPERFFPENCKDRHPYAYIPFAAGPRNCIGQRFAMMELKAVLATVLKHYSVKSLDPRDRIIPCPALVLRPSKAIRLKISSRKHI